MARPVRSVRARARVARGWSLGFYIAGIAALGSGVLAGAIVAAATGTAAGLAVAALIAGTGVATGSVGLWESRRFRSRAEALERTASERRLYALAEEVGGVLRVADVVRGLGFSTTDAEALLDGLVDEVRVSMQVTDDGEIRYLFRELQPDSQARVRVDVVEESPQEVREAVDGVEPKS